jgi:DNA-binding SARP family transcriptional activator/pimeloyl-ACP methyl ester carboxylesterase
VYIHAQGGVLSASVRLLGDFLVEIDGRVVSADAWPRRNAASLVKLLALSPGRQLHRERVIDCLWPDLRVDEAAPRLHKAAHYARKVLGRAEAIVVRGDVVALLPGVELTVDAVEFDEAARSALADGSVAAARSALEGFGGDLLPHDLYEPWLDDIRDRLDRRRRQLLRQAGLWEELLALDPTDEEARVALMRQRVTAGDLTAALREFERLERVLGRELGTVPGPEATQLRTEIIVELRRRERLSPAEETRLDQRIKFCRTTDGVNLAYAITGSGPPLVKAANWMTHVDYDWNSPVWRHWLEGLSRRHQLIRYDERGCGLSDRDAPAHSFDAWISDLEAVVDAAGLDRFPLLGISQGGAVAIAYAARHPERVSHLVIYGSYAQGRVTRARSEADLRLNQLQIDLALNGWGIDDPAFRQVFTMQFIPEGTRALWDAFNELQRETCSPENAARVLELSGRIDVTDLARQVQAPTLVLHARDDRRPPFEQGRLIASLIPDSRFVALDSSNHILLGDEPAWPRFLAEVEAFLELPDPGPADRRTPDISSPRSG